MATVAELVPGDRVTLGFMSGTYVAHTAHPLYRGLELVVWKLDDGEWSHDALSSDQYIGEVVAGSDRRANLRAALLGSGVTP